MTDLNNSLREIALQTLEDLQHGSHEADEDMILSAMKQAIKLALSREPSLPMRQAALDACRRAQDLNSVPPVRVGYECHAADIIYRAMTAQAIAELEC